MVPVVLVSPVVDLDSLLTPPPPLTSVSGFRSRTSILPFLTRRQTDRTTLIFGICFFMRNLRKMLPRSYCIALRQRSTKSHRHQVLFSINRGLWRLYSGTGTLKPCTSGADLGGVGSIAERLKEVLAYRARAWSGAGSLVRQRTARARTRGVVRRSAVVRTGEQKKLPIEK